MFEDTRYFLAALALVIAAGLMWGTLRQSQSMVSTRFSERLVGQGIEPQAVEGRRVLVQQNEFEPAGSIGTEGAVDLFGPLMTKVDFRGHLFVADYGDFKIKEFDPDLEFIRSYGEGQGQGPGEFNTITDYDVAEGGHLWVVDARNGRISIFAPDGSLERTLKSAEIPYRLSIDPGAQTFTSMLNSVDDRLFGQFASNGMLEFRFGQLIEDQGEVFIALDGRIEGLPAGGMLYAGTYAGILVAFDANGEPSYLRQTVARRPLPRVVRDGNNMSVDPEAAISAISLSIDGDRAWIFTYEREGFAGIGYLDGYDLESGDYLYSMRIPESANWVAMGAGYVYSVSEEMAIRRWVAPNLETADATAVSGD